MSVPRSIVTHRADQIVRAEEIQNDTIIEIVVHSIGGSIVSTEIGISQSFDVFVECLKTRDSDRTWLFVFFSYRSQIIG